MSHAERIGDVSIRVAEISRAYGDVKAVDGVDFVVRRGEIVGLLGPNGAGKTTTLRMLATLLRPDAGRIEVEGHDTATEPLSVRGSIGYLTGDTGLYGRLTPREFLAYFGQLHGMEPPALKARIVELVDQIGLGEFADRRCQTLSTGQKQRVSLARALLTDPPVIILDEPTSGLDIVSSQFVLDALTEARDAGRAVLFSTHILSEVELVCDRVLVLDRGRIVARGTVDSLLEETGERSFARAFLSMLELEPS